MHDYRYNPFSDALETVAITGENHVIPTNSPYTIRLAEVPLKESPSTVSLTINGVAGVEVAADPAAGEFWADYNTGADGDDNWNTGTIKFNAADAGKTVVAAYKGMGTLAGVKSNRYPAWWLERGDGSDGDFAPTANCTISGLKQYKSVYIPAGVTVTVEGFVRICCQGAFVNKGTITANGKGEQSKPIDLNYDYSFGHNTISNGGGSSYPGDCITINNKYVTINNDMLNFIMTSGLVCFGGAGGRNLSSNTSLGGGGGGCIQIVATSFSNNGVVSSNGNNGQVGTYDYHKYGSGGGGGGCIQIVCKTNINTGTLQVNGGNGAVGDPPLGKTGAPGAAGITIVKELGV